MKIMLLLLLLTAQFYGLENANADCSPEKILSGCHSERECSEADNPHHERCSNICVTPQGYFCAVDPTLQTQCKFIGIVQRPLYSYRHNKCCIFKNGRKLDCYDKDEY